MLDIARTLSTSTSVHALTGSSRPGAAPTVTLGVTSVFQPARGQAGDTGGHVDAKVIDLAGRVKRLAQRLTRGAEQVRDLSQQVRDEHRSAMDTVGRSATQEEFKVHAAEVRAAEERIGLPRLLKARRRMMARLVRWTGQLVAAEPQTLTGLDAKGETISPVQEAQRGDLLADDLIEAVERDTVRLTGSSATAGAHPALVAHVEEFRRLRRTIRAMEVASKGRDVDEMPGWQETCGRVDEIVGALYEMPAESMADLVVMARVVQTRWVRDNHRFAPDLGHKFADDVLRFFGREVSSAPAAPRDLIVDLFRQADAFRAAGNAAEDQAAAERAYEQEIAAQERAIASPPRTVEGAIAGIEWARADLLDYADQAPGEGDRFQVAMLDGALGVLRGIAGPRFTASHADAELLALGRAWKDCADRHDRAVLEKVEAEDRVISATPPEVLFLDVEKDPSAIGAHSCPHYPTGRRWYGDHAVIGRMRKPWPYDFCLERRDAILAAYDAWTAERDAADKAAGVPAATEAVALVAAEHLALRRRVLAIPAQTLDGLMLKLSVARWCLGDVGIMEVDLKGFVASGDANEEAFALAAVLDASRVLRADVGASATLACDAQAVPPDFIEFPAGRYLTGVPRDVVETYRTFLDLELKYLNDEVYGRHSGRMHFWHDNPAARLHHPGGPEASSRAAAVLGLLGLMPVQGRDGRAQAAASAA